MTDLSKVVDYDATVPVTIHSDETGDVVFHVRSIDNPEAQAFMSRNRAKAMAKKAGNAEDQDEYVGSVLADMIDPPADILATCVVSWEWNGHEFGKLGKDPAHTPENVAGTLRHKWIKDLVTPKALDLRNFMTA